MLCFLDFRMPDDWQSPITQRFWMMSVNLENTYFCAPKVIVLSHYSTPHLWQKHLFLEEPFHYSSFPLARIRFFLRYHFLWFSWQIYDYLQPVCITEAYPETTRFICEGGIIMLLSVSDYKSTLRHSTDYQNQKNRRSKIPKTQICKFIILQVSVLSDVKLCSLAEVY
jgi:hypothetical protein